MTNLSKERVSEINALAGRIDTGNGLFNAAEIKSVTDELLQRREAAEKSFMYGIADPDGNPHFDEFCVSRHADLVQDTVDMLNAEDGGAYHGYEVVALYREPSLTSAERERLTTLERVVAGLPQEAIDGGCTASGISAHAKAVERALITLHDLLSAIAEARPGGIYFNKWDKPIAHALAVLPIITDSTPIITDKPQVITDNERWCPHSDPITGDDFFLWMNHPTLGYVPTYGGPLDSYTLTERDENGEWFHHRYDHDEGAWVDDEAVYLPDDSAPQTAPALPVVPVVSAPQPDHFRDATKLIAELTMLVKRLAYSLRRAKPDSKVAEQASQYLRDKGLVSAADCLRGDDKSEGGEA